YPLHSVEPEVAQRHRGIRTALGRNLAAISPAVPAHLEEIGKIAGKLNAEPEVVRPDVEITDEDALIACIIPNELEAVHMEQLTAQATRSHAWVDQIHPQYGIVLLYIRAEEQ